VPAVSILAVRYGRRLSRVGGDGGRAGTGSVLGVCFGGSVLGVCFGGSVLGV